MKKFAIAAVVTALGLAAVAPAQDNTTIQTTTTISGGPWQLRKSTGDKAIDRFWFIADRTLNAGEKDTLRTMFRKMGGGIEHTIEKAIINAIDSSAKANSSYGLWSSADWMTDNGMSDIQVFNAMTNGLSWWERGVLDDWLTHATTGEMMAVGKLVRMGGWANSMWTTSPLNTGG